MRKIKKLEKINIKPPECLAIYLNPIFIKMTKKSVKSKIDKKTGMTPEDPEESNMIEARITLVLRLK